MSGEIEILKTVCRSLELAEISYMITGAFAANFYAVPRMTLDLDIIIQIKKGDADKIFKLFKQGFYVDIESINEAISHQGMFNIIHNEAVFKIDFIICKEKPYRRVEFQRKVQIPIDDSFVWVVSPEDLIISKLYWGKDSIFEMQLRDIRNLFQCVKGLDQEYIKHWVAELNLGDMYERVGIDERYQS